LQEKPAKKPAFEPKRHLSRIDPDWSRETSDQPQPYNTLMREAEICLNMCQIPRLHIVCQRSFEPPQKNAPDASGDTPATNRLERRLNQANKLKSERARPVQYRAHKQAVDLFNGRAAIARGTVSAS
jgi:hypothetical protein